MSSSSSTLAVLRPLIVVAALAPLHNPAAAFAFPGRHVMHGAALLGSASSLVPLAATLPASHAALASARQSSSARPPRASSLFPNTLEGDDRAALFWPLRSAGGKRHSVADRGFTLAARVRSEWEKDGEFGATRERSSPGTCYPVLGMRGGFDGPDSEAGHRRAMADIEDIMRNDFAAGPAERRGESGGGAAEGVEEVDLDAEVRPALLPQSTASQDILP